MRKEPKHQHNIVRAYLAEIGRIGGKVRSAAKSSAAKLRGKQRKAARART